MANIITGIKNYFFPITSVAPIVGNQNNGLSPQKNLSNYISPVQLERLRHDIKMWRSAVTEAEAAFYPHRVRMQRMYLDTVLNGQVFSAIERRKDMTLLRDYKICDSKGIESDDLTALFKKKEWFDNFLNYAMDAIFYGYNLISLGDAVDNEFPDLSIIRRWNISPDRHNVTSYVYSLSGADFLDPEFADWHVWVPTPTTTGVNSCGYGILYQVGVYEIYLRNVLGWNADFTEIFAQPLRVAKTMKQNEEERAELERSMQQMGSSGYLIMDPTDEVEFVESSLGGTGYKSYESIEARCEKKISKIILGHADALDSIPGKLGGGQKNGTNEDGSPVAMALGDKQVKDGRFIEYIVNKSLIPKMRNLGFNIPDGYHFEFKNDNEVEDFRRREDESNAKTAEIFQTIKNAGGKPDWGYFTERTGIPVEDAPIPAPLKLPPPNGDKKPFNDRLQNRLNNLYK